MSTTNQVIEHDSSIDTQIERIRQTVAYKAGQAQLTGGAQWQLVGEYREEGRSGKDTDRPELQRMLADVRAGKIDAVVATKIDRITRSLIDFYDLWKIFEESDVEFISLGESFDSSSAAGRAMLKLTLVFAELERERTSERTKEKIQARRGAGKWFGGAIPFGYASHPTDKTTLVPDEHAAEIALGIFGAYLKLGSARAVVRHLGAKELKRPTRTTRRGEQTGGRPFTTQTILTMLQNLTYVAKRRLDDGTIIDCNWPAIIPLPMFDAAQKLLVENSEKRPTGKDSVAHVYLLEGLLRCGACSSMMARASATGRNEQFYYYKCSRKHRTANTACTVRDVRADKVEEFVLRYLRDLAIDPVALKHAVHEANGGRDGALAEIASQLQEKRTAYLQASKVLVKAADALDEDGADVKLLVARVRDREKVVEQLKEEIGALEAKEAALRAESLDAEVVAEGYLELRELLAQTEQKGARMELRDLLRGVIEVIEWHQDKADPKSGEAIIELYPLPRFWSGVNGDDVGSSTRQAWLRLLDSNQRPQH